MNKWTVYEMVKGILQQLDLTPEQYEKAIRKLTEILGL